MSILSPFRSLKERLASRKSASQTPARVSELIAEQAKQLADAKDLRTQQTLLLQKQVQHRKDAPIRRQLAKAQRLLFRTRVRRPQAGAFVRDVLVSGDGKHERMYMKLTNGQLVCATKPHKNPVLRATITKRLTEDTQSAAEFKTEVQPGV